MPYLAHFLFTVLLGLAIGSRSAPTASTKPNILMIMSDDQDKHMNSVQFQRTVQEELIKKGLLAENHFTTTSNCCPSRASLLRGQASHNTNITHVKAPGGGYQKWVMGGEDNHYLPIWLRKAGYRVEYIGKLMNGQNVYNYNSPSPKGWDHIDFLIEPYTYIYNTPVMSANGDTPVWYDQYHQTDVIRAKAMDRLGKLTTQSDPWFLVIAPTSPHVDSSQGPPVPLVRHETDFPNLTVPRPDNFNPLDDTLQRLKPSWLKELPVLNSTQLDRADLHYKRRIQALQGVDEIVHDTLRHLESVGALDNTYVIYLTDNGYHIGTHRVTSGKTLPYIEDTNIPLVVRGPGIPADAITKTPSTHIDLAPTLLDIAGVAQQDLPPLFDGRSLLGEWQYAGNFNASDEVDREIINVEFWGHNSEEDRGERKGIGNGSYKTMRVVGEKYAWLYSVWCTGDIELYDTKTDPYELYNLVPNPTPEHAQILNRLNALLLVTKSCIGASCRNPWPTLKPTNTSLSPPTSLTQALRPEYNSFFSGFPAVRFKECLEYQLPSNEGPFLPESAGRDLGMKWRNATDNYAKGLNGEDCGYKKVEGTGKFGTKEQRNATLVDVMKKAKVLNETQLPGKKCQVIGLPPN